MSASASCHEERRNLSWVRFISVSSGWWPTKGDEQKDNHHNQSNFGNPASDLYLLNLGVPKPRCFKPGGLQFSCGSALLRSFAPFCGLAFALTICAHNLRSQFALTICAFARFCVQPRLEQPRLGTADEWIVWRLSVCDSVDPSYSSTLDCVCVIMAIIVDVQAYT